MFDNLLNFFKTESTKREDGGAVDSSWHVGLQNPSGKSVSEQMLELCPPKNGAWSEGEERDKANQDSLLREFEYFQSVKEELKAKYGHGTAVIKNRYLVGVWPDRQTALKEGLEILGYQSMLVQDIEEKKSAIVFEHYKYIQ